MFDVCSCIAADVVQRILRENKEKRRLTVSYRGAKTIRHSGARRCSGSYYILRSSNILDRLSTNCVIGSETILNSPR